MPAFSYWKPSVMKIWPTDEKKAVATSAKMAQPSVGKMKRC